MTNRAVFIDRDGTISADCTDEDRVGKDRLEIFAYVPEAIRILNNNGFEVFVVTNQPGISKGLFTADKVKFEHEDLISYLEEHGAFIRGIYVCPHTDKDNCECRKPKVGMLREAKKEWNINLEVSFVVGDSGRDIKMGADSGCTTIFIRGNHYTNTKPDYIANDLLVAVGIILGKK